MQTVGQLIDQLQIVRLKYEFADTTEKRVSTSKQVAMLEKELETVMSDLRSGARKRDLVFPANKVYSRQVVVVGDPPSGCDVEELISGLATINRLMWQNQERLYEIRSNAGSLEEVYEIVDRACALNLERNAWIDSIDRAFAEKHSRRGCGSGGCQRESCQEQRRCDPQS